MTTVGSCTWNQVIYYSVAVADGRLQTRDRQPLWENLHGIGSTLHDPWLLLSDVNSVLSPDDKQGGLPVTRYETKDFL